MDMFLHMFEGTFTQILESQQRLSKKLKNGPYRGRQSFQLFTETLLKLQNLCERALKHM